MPSLTIRYDDHVHRKLKVIAAYQGMSLNALIMKTFDEVIQRWEGEHGAVLLPDETGKEKTD